MKKLLIANLKQNKTIDEFQDYITNLQFKDNQNCEIVIAPSFVHIAELCKKNNLNIKIAAQTVSPFPKGTYTGAVGAFQLKDLGVSYCIVGHSERRKYFSESSQIINNQIKELETVGITPIVCFSNIAEVRQIEVTKSNYYLAYEPLDSIGNGSTMGQADDNEDIQKTFNEVNEIVGDFNFIYGGSVNINNINRLENVNDISGYLVGTASLDAKNFIQIYNEIN